MGNERCAALGGGQYGFSLRSIPGKELAQELDSIYSCKSGPGMEEFLETWHRKYTSNASAPGNQNDTLRNVYNLFTTLFNPAPTLRPRGFRSDSAYRYVVIQSQLTFCIAEDGMFDYYYESSPPPTFPTDGFYLLRKAGAYYRVWTISDRKSGKRG